MAKTLSKSEILSKFGKLFASPGSVNRPVLEGIHYAADGTALVTNSHYALRIRDGLVRPQPFTLHAKTGHMIEGAYPDFSRLFPVDFHDEIEILQHAVPEALLSAQCVAAVAMKLNKKLPLVSMEVEEAEVRLEIDSRSPYLRLAVKIGDAPIRSKSIRTFNAEYFATALAVFDAADSAVKIKLRGPHDPIVLSNDNGIDVIILPYRIPA